MAREQVRTEADMGELLTLPDDMDVAGDFDQVAKCLQAVSDFAEVIDWRCEIPSKIHRFPEEFSMTMSENDQALRCGSFVKFEILPRQGSMRMQGGYYDAFHQPTVLCESLFPMGNGGSHELESSLSSMCQILEKYYRTFVTPLAKSRL